MSFAPTPDPTPGDTLSCDAIEMLIVTRTHDLGGFTVHRATGLFGSDAKPPYDYIEVIDIHGMDAFVADVSDPEFQKVAAGFGEFTDNPCFILTEDL